MRFRCFAAQGLATLAGLWQELLKCARQVAVNRLSRQESNTYGGFLKTDGGFFD